MRMRRPVNAATELLQALRRKISRTCGRHFLDVNLVRSIHELKEILIFSHRLGGAEHEKPVHVQRVVKGRQYATL